MVKEYISSERTLSPRPRSKRRRETGEGGSTSNITVVQNGSGGSAVPVVGDGHTHDNKTALDKLGVSGGYVTITDWQENGEGNLEKSTSKARAGHADRSDIAQNLAEDSTDWQTIDDKIEASGNKFLRKDQNDATPYNLGVGGDAFVLGRATTHELDTGNAVFRDRATSQDFISGFVAGTGWGITKEQIENALGVVETKYHLEIDKLSVRGQMRIYEMIISQLLGENDNRVFTAMMEVDHYDAVTGRVYFDNKGGRLYNPFRHDDYVRVQQYNPAAGNGYIIKSYELLIADIYSGFENGERVDWVTIKDFSPSAGLPSEMITEGDTFTRWDNKTDAERKGLIGITTVGPSTPYIDIVHGAKTDPANALKGRIGNLSGVSSPLFGQLGGFGELLTNLYAVGDFRMRRTGESIDAKIEMLKSGFSTRISRQIYEITEEDNYLTNATFTENMDGWTPDSDEDGRFLSFSDGAPVILNGSTVATGAHRANVEECEGRQMLHLQATGISQANALVRKPGTHKEYVVPTGTEATGSDSVDVRDTLYLSIRFLPRTSGLLTVGFRDSGDNAEDALPYTENRAIDRSGEWITLQWSGTWNGVGDFYLKYTGEMYVSLLSLTGRPLDEFRKQTTTQFIQNDQNILLLGQNIDRTKGSLTNLGIELRAADEQIRLYVSTSLQNYYTRSEIDITVNGIEQNVTRLRGDLADDYNSKIGTLQANLDAANSSISAVSTSLSGLRSYIDGAFGDGVISEAEAVAIEKYLNTLQSTMVGAQNTYATLYGNSLLENAEKTALLAAWNLLSAAHTSLRTAINSAISDSEITTSEKSSVNTAFDTFNTRLGEFQSKVEELYTNIEERLKAYIDAQIEAAQAALRNYADSKVDKPQYESSVNPWYSWTGGTEHTHIGEVVTFTGADGTVSSGSPSGATISWKNGRKYRYFGYDTNTWEDVTEIAITTAFFNNYSDRLEGAVGNFNADGSLTDAAGQRISAFGATLWASHSDYDALSGRVSGAESQINVVASGIEQKVSRDGVISAINQSAENITIDASKISLKGYVSLNGGLSVSPTNVVTIGGFTAYGQYFGTTVSMPSVTDQGVQVSGVGMSNERMVYADSSAGTQVSPSGILIYNGTLDIFSSSTRYDVIRAEGRVHTGGLCVGESDGYGTTDYENKYTSLVYGRTGAYTLPSNPGGGRMVFVKPGSSGLTVYAASGHKIVKAVDNEEVSYYNIGQMSMLFVFASVGYANKWITFYCG